MRAYPHHLSRIPRAIPFLSFLFVFFLLQTSFARAANMLADTEFTGQSYRSFELIAPVPDFCRKVCEKDEGCQGWMFSWPGKKGKRAKCFLFRTVEGKRKDTCCIAGYREKSFSFGKAVAGWLKGEPSAQRPNEGGSQAPSSAEPRSEERLSPSRFEGAPPANSETAQDRQLQDRREKQAKCREYAETAMAANREAQELGCGFRGGLWNASYDAYFMSCMKKPLKAAEWKTKKRSAQLRECRRAIALRRQREADPLRRWEETIKGEWRKLRERLSRADERRRERPPAARELSRRARYVYSWLKRSGPGPRATPWRPTLSGKCPLVRACECPQGNTCGVYEPGSIAIHWPQGCGGPPAYVVCRVRRR